MSRKRGANFSRRSKALKTRKRVMLADSVEVMRRKSSLNLGHLNIEGLREQKMMDVEEAMRLKDMDAVVLIETHQRRETKAKILVEGCEVFEARRSNAGKDKKGGGIAVVCRRKEGMTFLHHQPPIQDPQLSYVANERLWVTTATPGGKTALCGVYMACQAAYNHHVEWNEGIYRQLSQEIFQLRARGNRIIIQVRVVARLESLQNSGAFREFYWVLLT